MQDPTLDDPLDNEEALQEQLESLPFLCRFQYERMAAYICSVMDPLLAQYRAVSTRQMTLGLTELRVRLIHSTHVHVHVWRCDCAFAKLSDQIQSYHKSNSTL